MILDQENSLGRRFLHLDGAFVAVALDAEDVERAIEKLRRRNGAFQTKSDPFVEDFLALLVGFALGNQDAHPNEIAGELAENFGDIGGGKLSANGIPHDYIDALLCPFQAL